MLVGLFRFQAGGRSRRPNPALVILGSLNVVVFRYGCMFAFAFVVFVAVFQY